MAEDTQDNKPAAQPEAGKAKPAAKADAGKAKPAKEKPPAIEEKPFEEFITEHFIPGIKASLSEQGIDDLNLSLEKRPIPIKGFDDSSVCPQVVGQWNDGKRQFFIAFQKDDIKAPKFYAASDYGAEPTILESFMIDERRVNLDLMVFYVVQRLNGQKWLTRN